MDALPVMAGLITAAGLVMLVLSLIAYRRTGMGRLLSISGISAILVIKGILMLASVWKITDANCEMMAGLDLLMVFVLAAALFGKE